jgi:hypothetical protein
MKTFALGKVAGILVSAGLVLGLLGSGVGASFIWTGTVNQPIQVGHETTTIYTVGAGTCPGSYTVTTSTGSIACWIAWGTPGAWNNPADVIVPTQFVVTPSVAGRITESHLWTITENSGGVPVQLDTLGSFTYASGLAAIRKPCDYPNLTPYEAYVCDNSGLSFEAPFIISWNNLSNVSFGDHFTITFTVVGTN